MGPPSVSAIKLRSIEGSFILFGVRRSGMIITTIDIWVKHVSESLPFSAVRTLYYRCG